MLSLSQKSLVMLQTKKRKMEMARLFLQKADRVFEKRVLDGTRKSLKKKTKGTSEKVGIKKIIIFGKF